MPISRRTRAWRRHCPPLRCPHAMESCMKPTSRQKCKSRAGICTWTPEGLFFGFGVFLNHSKRTSSISEFRIPSRVRRALLEFATQPKSPPDHVDRPLATWTPSRSDLRPCGVYASVLDPQEHAFCAWRHGPRPPIRPDRLRYSFVKV